jgi:hypothetical protein
VSPKKIGKRKKECPNSGTSESRKTRAEDRCGSKGAIIAAVEVVEEGREAPSTASQYLRSLASLILSKRERANRALTRSASGMDQHSEVLVPGSDSSNEYNYYGPAKTRLIPYP